MYNHNLILFFLKRGILVCLFILLQNSFVIAQNSERNVLQNAQSVIQTVIEQERFVERFLDMDAASQNAHTLPIGFHRTFGNTSFTIAISNISFGSQYGEATLYVDMPVPQENRRLMFGATGVKISHDGDLIGDVKLSLLSDVSISMGSMGRLIIKGGTMNKSTGTASSSTYLSLECNGDFKELSIDADFILNPNTFVSALDKKSEVVTSFRTTIHDWNDLLVQVSFPPFEIKGVDGFEFSLSEATLDLSDIRNSELFSPSPEYFSRYFTLPDRSLWRGIYVDNFKVSLPSWFKNKNSNEKVTIEANRLLIDENGITGDILGKNILPIESGDANGWAFSVNTFHLNFIANNINAFGFAGQLGVPLSETPELLNYEAYISGDEYLFKATLADSMDFSLFGTSKLHLDPTSYVQMQLKNGKLCPRLVMNGAMAMDTLGLKIEEITFKKLTIATEAPFFSVEAMGYGGEVQLYNFPITISNIDFQANDRKASLAFDLKINLMKEKIAAESRLQLHSERINDRWYLEGLQLDAIMLDNISLAGFSLDGEIQMVKNHPVYGDYFGGDITATFGALSNDLTVNVASIFGRKDFRYWFVEGAATFGGIGIPVGPVALNGFTGGAYYRMSATGQKGLSAYVPDESCSLGVKAGVSYSIGGINTVSGKALYEMNFLSGGGVKNIRFYGTAEFMSNTMLSDLGLDKLDDMYKTAQGKSQDLSQGFVERLPSGLSGSDAAKQLIPGVKLSGDIGAYLSMDYDFPTKTFDADFRLMVDVGGILKGTGQNNEAGWAKLYCSPQTWYIHAGTPRNPIGLQMGLGPLSLKTQSYFMLGDKLENPIAPPQSVLNILGISEVEADYMKYPSVMESGKGVGFGSRFAFDTGDITFLILYARFATDNGFDIMLRDMSNYVCEGSNSPIGINGWYANGQCYASLYGELGVNVKLLLVNRRFTVIRGAAAALLQARLPNPTWIGGYMGVRLNILGGMINANMKMKFSFGDDCKLVNINGDSSPIEFPLIADLNPVDGSSNVDIFQSPQATFNMGMGEPFDIEDSDGVKTYRIVLDDFYVVDNSNKRLKGEIDWNRDYTAATFRQEEVFPPNKDLTAFVSVTFEERINGRWQKVTQNGKEAKEFRRVSFKTGEAPNYIPLHNIVYCYPVVDQKNFYLRESGNGYVKLRMGQSYLFPPNFQYEAIATTESGQQQKAVFRYNARSAQIDYMIPNLRTATNYKLTFVASSQAGQQGSAGVIKTNRTIEDTTGESYSIDFTQQAAQKIIQDGSMTILEYDFRSSSYNTLRDKLNSIRFTGLYYRMDYNVVNLFLDMENCNELFDEIELVGNRYTENKPLLVPEAILDDNYYKTDIAPLLYNGYSSGGISITHRAIQEYGVPPNKAFYLYDGYLNYIRGSRYNNDLFKKFPFVYGLPLVYSNDFDDLGNKAANKYINGVRNSYIDKLYQSVFPFIRQGNYRSIIEYNLPNGQRGTSVEIMYYNSLDFRK